MDQQSRSSSAWVGRYIMNTDNRQATIDWLIELGCPVLPVAPKQDPYEYPRVVKAKSDKGIWEHCPFNKDSLKDGRLEPDSAFTGKNPSYLDSRGKPRLINHREYQKRLPTEAELKLWFANPANGVGTLGGWGGIYYGDLDRKHFPTQQECDQAFAKILALLPGVTWTEQTHSGGYRIAVALKEPPGFTNWALEPGGEHVGEVLGDGRFAVLDPTIGPSGNPYVRLNRCKPVEVESLESIGFHPTKTQKQAQPSVECPKPAPSNTPGSIPLEKLITPASQRILNGDDIKGDCSESLTVLLRDAYGWQNWCIQNNQPCSGSAEELARYAGERLGIDAERVDRILKTVNANDCAPSAHFKGGDDACRKKVNKLIEANQVKSKRFAKTETSNRPQVLVGSLSSNRWPSLESYNYELGRWVESKDGDLRFVPVADFDFTVKRVLESEEGGGFVLAVERLRGGKLILSEAVIKSVELTKVADFINALKKQIGSNLACNMKQEDLQRLIHVREEEYFQKGGRTYRQIDRVGRQPDGTWVFEYCQFTKDGKPTTEEESGWVWNAALGEIEKIPSPKIAEQNPDALNRLVIAAAGFFHPETLPLFYFTCGFVTANLQWQEIIDQEARFPVLSAYGDPGGGKSTAVDVAMSLVGMHGQAIQRFSESLAFEYAKSLSGLPVFLDDPIKKGTRPEERVAIENFAWALFNGRPRYVRGNTQRPHTSVAITTNPALGEGDTAAEGRLAKLHFPVKDSTPGQYQALREAMRQASGGLGQLIAIGYPKAEIDNLESRIIEHLHSSHARISQNLALITFYAQKFCDLAGVEFDALSYCLNCLCPAADDLESDKDSLTDYLEKLQVLQSENLIGEWNVTITENREGEKFLALWNTSVWPEFNKRFSVNYSKQTVERLAQDRGAIRQPVKFVDSKLTWIEYLRDKADAQRDCHIAALKPPSKNVGHKSILIPYELVAQIWEPDEQVTCLTKLPDELPEEVTSEAVSEQGFQKPVTSVTQVTLENWTPKRGSRVKLQDGLLGTVSDIEDGYFYSVSLDEPILLEDGDTLRCVIRGRDQLFPPDELPSKLPNELPSRVTSETQIQQAFQEQVTQVTEVTPEKPHSVPAGQDSPIIAADTNWEPKEGERIWARRGQREKWIEAQVLAVPNNSPDPAKRLSYWRVKPETGFEFYVWSRSDLAPITEAA
jgi:hypothetical protein